MHPLSSSDMHSHNPPSHHYTNTLCTKVTFDQTSCMLWFRHNGSPQNHLVWLTNVVESLLSRIHHSPTHRE